jgi:hypothetical protein
MAEKIPPAFMAASQKPYLSNVPSSFFLVGKKSV